MADRKTLATEPGAPVADNQHSQTAGTAGNHDLVGNPTVLLSQEGGLFNEVPNGRTRP